MQKQAILNWLASEHVEENSVEWYTDSGIDGTPSTSGFDALSKEINTGKISTVLVWKLDRLSRTMRNGVSILTDLCNRGIRIVSVAQGIDLQGGETPEMRLLAALQEIEAVAIEERRIANIAEAERKEATKQRRIEAARKQKETVWKLYHSGMSVTEIAEKLGISVNTVNNHLIIY